MKILSAVNPYIGSRQCSVPTMQTCFWFLAEKKSEHEEKNYLDWLGKSCRFIPWGAIP